MTRFLCTLSMLSAFGSFVQSDEPVKSPKYHVYSVECRRSGPALVKATDSPQEARDAFEKVKDKRGFVVVGEHTKEQLRTGQPTGYEVVGKVGRGGVIQTLARSKDVPDLAPLDQLYPCRQWFMIAHSYQVASTTSSTE